MIDFVNDIDTIRDSRVCLVCDATEEEVEKIDFTSEIALDINFISIFVVKTLRHVR